MLKSNMLIIAFALLCKFAPFMNNFTILVKLVKVTWRSKLEFREFFVI